MLLFTAAFNSGVADSSRPLKKPHTKKKPQLSSASRHVTQTYNTAERLRTFLFLKQSRKSQTGLIKKHAMSHLLRLII